MRNYKIPAALLSIGAAVFLSSASLAETGSETYRMDHFSGKPSINESEIRKGERNESAYEKLRKSMSKSSMPRHERNKIWAENFRENLRSRREAESAVEDSNAF